MNSIYPLRNIRYFNEYNSETKELEFSKYNFNFDLYKSEFGLGDKTKLEIFERGPAKRYNLQNYSKLIIEVNNILKKHKESPMAFVKKDKLVICNRDYRMKVLEIADAKNYLAKAKPFILMLSNILKENDADTRRQR